MGWVNLKIKTLYSRGINSKSVKNLPSWKINSLSATQEGDSLILFYETGRFITECTTAHPQAPSWATQIQSTSPHPQHVYFPLLVSALLSIPCIPVLAKLSCFTQIHHSEHRHTSNTWSPLAVKDKVFYLYGTTANIIVFYIIYALDSRRKETRF